MRARDLYNFFKATDYWVRFQYPFWYNKLAMALESLSCIGFTADHPRIKKGLIWLAEHQSEDGLSENYRNNVKNIRTQEAWEDRL